MKTYIFLFVCLLSSTYICASNDTENQTDEENVPPVATPMSTPIYVGKSLYCRLYDYDCGNTKTNVMLKGRYILGLIKPKTNGEITDSLW